MKSAKVLLWIATAAICVGMLYWAVRSTRGGELGCELDRSPLLERRR